MSTTPPVSPDPSGITEDMTPQYAPGTYEFTKRVEVDQDGNGRFVDVPDGEYVAGFWHKTRSRVRRVDSDEPPADGVDVLATKYDVSVLPRDDINRSAWSITVAYRGNDRYAVLIRDHWSLARDGSSEIEPARDDRTDEWLAEHRFTREEALKLAVEHAPNVRCNGKTAVELLEWLEAQESSGVAGGGAQ